MLLCRLCLCNVLQYVPCVKFICSCVRVFDVLLWFVFMALLDVFFFKQRTAYEMRISDWSSYLCSSDLSQGLAQEPLRCLGAAGRRQVEIDRVAPLVDCPVQVGPLAPHLDVGFIQAPARIKATPPEPAQPLLHLRGVALDPAIDRRMVDRNAAFRQHFLKVAI